MSIELTSIEARNSRRLRLVFSNSLAPGAFSSTSFYTITAINAYGASPNVKAAMIVPGSVACVELVLSTDLVSDGVYSVAAVGVPALDSTVSTITSTQEFSYGRSVEQFNVEPIGSVVEVVFYLRDLVWTGSDFLETSNGDLAVVEGVQNAEQALLRRLTGSPLPWDPTYSPNTRQYIDGPTIGAISLKGALVSQSLKDDRVQSVKVTLTSDPDKPEEAYFSVQPILIGGHATEPISISL